MLGPTDFGGGTVDMVELDSLEGGGVSVTLITPHPSLRA